MSGKQLDGRDGCDRKREISGEVEGTKTGVPGKERQGQEENSYLTTEESLADSGALRTPSLFLVARATSDT